MGLKGTQGCFAALMQFKIWFMNVSVFSYYMYRGCERFFTKKKKAKTKKQKQGKQIQQKYVLYSNKYLFMFIMYVCMYSF
jgi:hypothetical protein